MTTVILLINLCSFLNKTTEVLPTFDTPIDKITNLGNPALQE